MWRSNALWDPDVYTGMYGDCITTDTHATREQAQGVCNGLEKFGFSGLGKEFPIKTWVSEIEEKDEVR